MNLWNWLFHRRQREEELDEEVQTHLRMAAQERIEQGETAEQARTSALREFGNVALVKEVTRDMWGFRSLETLLQDLRYGARQLRRNPGFTAVAVITLALGIGANIALFSVMNVMLLRALPVRNPQELVEFVRLAPDGTMMGNLEYPEFEHLRKNTSVLSGVFAFWSDTRVLRSGAGSERVLVHEVSGSFFPTLGVKPLLGRAIDPTDDRPDAEHQVVVLSYPFWSSHFGRDPAIVGATVRINGAPCIVIGVMPPDFFGVDRSQNPAMWVPLASSPNPGYVWVLGRLKPGVSIPQARAQLEPLFHQARGVIQG